VIDHLHVIDHTWSAARLARALYFGPREVVDMTRGSGLDGRPRMVDVGRLANVSAQTVSRYYTGGYVGRSARERIERAVAELGYRPHPAARRLKSNRAEAIGVIAMGPPNFGIWSILEGMTRGVRHAGFTLVIGQLDILAGDPDSPSEVEAAVDHLLLSGVDGIVVATPYAGAEELLGDSVTDIPVVVISERPEATENSIGGDSYQAGLLAMEHLIALGHRRILHVSGDPATIESAQREASYRDSLARHGVQPLPVRGRDWTAEAGYEIGTSADPQEFSAVFAGNDAIASGFMSAMRTRGLDAPRDYSIVGIDNMPETRFYAPPLTTVTLDFVALGQTAVDMMLQRIRDGGSVPRHTISPRLEVRQSTAPALPETP
jgi:DNA-binding LacI/PurR family transcriptional regulator